MTGNPKDGKAREGAKKKKRGEIWDAARLVLLLWM
jgi:hypothetical protein